MIVRPQILGCLFNYLFAIEMEPELEAFLKDNKDFQLNDHGKVHCNVTNHDIVAKMSEVKKHMESDKYLHAKNW